MVTRNGSNMTRYRIILIYRQGLTRVSFWIASAYSYATAHQWYSEQGYPAHQRYEVREVGVSKHYQPPNF